MDYRVIITGRNVEPGFTDGIARWESLDPADSERRIAETCTRKGWSVAQIVRGTILTTVVVDTNGRAY